MAFLGAGRAGRIDVALEITPPRRAGASVLRRRAGLLDGWAAAINVIQRPDRQSSLAASLVLRAAGMNPVWHLVNRGRGRAEIAADLATAAAGGIMRVLCLRGDHAGRDTAETPSIREVIASTRSALPDAVIGATLNQYATDRRAVLRNLLPKLAAGAAYVQTQPVFDLTTLRPLAEELRQTSPETGITPMLMPLLSADAATAIESRLAIRLPDRWIDRLRGGGSEAGWRAFEETIAALADASWVDGVAIMTFETDPSPEVGARIVAALRTAGVTASPHLSVAGMTTHSVMRQPETE